MMAERGFTLLEVLLATLILASGIYIVANAWSGNYLQIRKARLYNNVSTLLEKKMTEMEVLYGDKPLTEIPEKLSGEFEGFPQYRWEFETKEMVMPDLAPLLVDREEGADDMLITVISQMTEFIGKAVKEGKLTVFVEVKGREVRYSVTTYFVDYNQDLAALGTTQ